MICLHCMLTNILRCHLHRRKNYLLLLSHYHLMQTTTTYRWMWSRTFGCVTEQGSLARKLYLYLQDKVKTLVSCNVSWIQLKMVVWKTKRHILKLTWILESCLIKVLDNLTFLLIGALLGMCCRVCGEVILG